MIGVFLERKRGVFRLVLENEDADLRAVLSPEAVRALRDSILKFDPVEPVLVTASGRKPRSDRKTLDQKWLSAAAAPGPQRVLRELALGPFWRQVRDIALVLGMGEGTTRTSLHSLKRVGWVESRRSDEQPNDGRIPRTEWRVRPKRLAEASTLVGLPGGS